MAVKMAGSPVSEASEPGDVRDDSAAAAVGPEAVRRRGAPTTVGPLARS